jgi:hypothetical protein
VLFGVLQKMKYIRYTFIAALACCLALSIKGIVTPTLTFALGSESELNRSEVDPQIYTNAIASYRMAVMPWIALIGLLLGGWMFLSRKKVVYGVALASVVLFGYIIFASIKSLGYTMTQSVSAVLQGHGNPLSGWTWFYLLALVALVIAATKSAEQVAP